MIPRHALWVRVAHWTVAASFLYLAATGLALYSPAFWWLGGGLSARVLHPWAGLVFTASFAVLAVRWLGQMAIRAEDVAFLRRFGDYLAHRPMPESGKFHAGQKLFFWAAAVAAVALLATGVVLWVPGPFGNAAWGWSRLLHGVAFAGLLCGFVYHVYFSTVAFPGTLMAMTRGVVSEAWARRHHARWFRER